MSIFYYKTNSEILGNLCITTENETMTRIEFVGDLFENSASDSFEKYISEKLDLYFSGQPTDLGDIPVHPEGTEFCMEVWDVVMTVRYGQKMTYGEIADRIAEKRGTKRMSAQAVGTAVGKNPIPIVVPCHRIVGKKDDLTGYSCGIDKKEYLLRLEKQDKL